MTERQLEGPPGWELQEDVGPAQWLVDGLLPWGAGIGTRVGAIVPPGFEAYVRILHPAYLDHQGEATAISWSEVASITGGMFHPQACFQRLVGADDWNDRGRFGGQPPDEGNAPRELIESVVAALGQFTDPRSRCWACVWDGYSFVGGMRTRWGVPPDLHTRLDLPVWGSRDVDRVSVPGRDYLLYRGTLDTVTRFDFLGGFQTPNIWWPDDRSWCVATEVDFDSTLVGGSEACSAVLMTTMGLETVELSVEDRLDHEGDTINGPPPV